MKETSKQAIQELKRNGVKRCIMLSGDRKEVGEHVAKELALDEDVYKRQILSLPLGFLCLRHKECCFFMFIERNEKNARNTFIKHG